MKHPGDIQSARLIQLKGWLFLLLCIIAVIGLLLPAFSWSNLALICLAIWVGCRWYYYLFFVIENYVDSGFRFASVSDAIRYLVRRSAK